MFAKHGLYDIIRRVNLKLSPKFLRLKSDTKLALPVEARLRMSFEKLGPTFVKLGQLLATRPDLIPIEWVEEFKKLHDQVEPVKYELIETDLKEHFKNFDETFLSFSKEPKAAASIAQVHHAVLKDSTEVVVKIRRPNIIKQINDDLNILYFVANLVHKYIPETRIYNPVGVVNEFAKALNLETDFIVEANNMLKFKQNFKNNKHIKIPNVHMNLSGHKILVMERIKGTPISSIKNSELKDIDTALLFKRGLKGFFHMVFSDRFFHGDLHSGNIFVLEENKIALLDFGVVGRLSVRLRDSIADMFLALTTEDYETLAYEFVDLAPYNKTINLESFSNDLRDLISPHFNLSLKNVNLGKVLMEAVGCASRHKVQLPSDLVMFFKSILTLESVGRTLISDFDLLSEATGFASQILRSKYDPVTISKNLGTFAKDSTRLVAKLPREANQLIKKFNNPDHRFNLEVHNLDKLGRVFEKSATLIFLGIVIGCLLIGASIALNFDFKVMFLGLPLPSSIGFLSALLLSFVAFYQYIKK